MPRKYSHVKEYEKEILKLKEKGLTKREIGNQLGAVHESYGSFFINYS